MADIPNTSETPVVMRGALDYDTIRNNIFSGVTTALTKRYPIENERYRLELGDLEYGGVDVVPLSEQKRAILSGGSLERPVKGTWSLVDKKTGNIVERKNSTVLRVPYLTQRGTFVLKGSEWTLSHQSRLRPGVYTRKRASGEYESHFNVGSGGPSFRILMEPQSGVFKVDVGQASIKLFPVMKAMGISDADLQSWWGPDLYQVNAKASAKDTTTLDKAWAKLARARARQELGETPERDFRMLFNKFVLDPDVTSKTLGERFNSIQPRTLLRATQKLINVSKNTEDMDDRDSLAYQSIHGPEDLIAERIAKDAGRTGARLLWRVTRDGNLNYIKPSALSSQINSLFYGSGLAEPLEEVNLMDNTDRNSRLVRIGEGGIADEAIPESARDVHPSHFLFVDPVKTAESFSVGVDLRLARNVKKGSDGNLYTQVMDKSGKQKWVSAYELAKSTVVFPDDVSRAKREGRIRLKALKAGKLGFATPEEVDYFAPSADAMFSFSSSFSPMVNGSKGGRLLMGGKMLAQAMPLELGEVPLVRASVDDDRDFTGMAGDYAGIVKADVGGMVTEITPDHITIKSPSGKTSTQDLYNEFPLNRKSMLSSRPRVKIGDLVSKNQLLASTNITDEQGNLALGRNLKVAYMAYGGRNYEDAAVISESAAAKLSSEHMYTRQVDKDSMTAYGKDKFISTFPKQYNVKQLDHISDDGVIKPGRVVEYGDPMILAIQQRTSRGSGMLYRGGKINVNEASVTWDHSFPGVVTDVWSDDGGVKVAVKAYVPAEVGDKVAGTRGDKHIISKIVSDDKMPRTANGDIMDILVNPLGVISRQNPSQLIEAALGKVAAKTGKPYVIPLLPEDDMVDFAVSELKKNSMSDTEDLIDPTLNRTIPSVFVGNKFYQKLAHTVESKSTGRSLGGYTADGLPTRSLDGDDKPKRIGLGEMGALIAHGAVNNIREIRTLKNQKNDDFWRAIAEGYAPPSPEIPQAYRKFTAMLKGAGINTKKKGENLHLTAMTDKDVDAISSGEITQPELVKWTASFGKGLRGEQSMEPVAGGLFDRGITGGHGGNRWSHLVLSEPMPSPVMGDVIRNMLDLTQKQYESVIAGRTTLSNGKTGGDGIRDALARIKPEEELRRQLETVRSSNNGNERDKAVKKVKFLRALTNQGTRLEDLVITKVPVIPPIFRPVSSNENFTLLSGSNKLYLDMMHADHNLKELKGQVTGDVVNTARLNVYKGLEAIAGLGDPIKPEHKMQGVQGLLKEIFGSTPKAGNFQNTLIGSSVDFAGRTTVIPNPDLSMDEIGIPEEQAWKLYSPFIMRRLIRTMGGRPDSKAYAIKQVSQRTRLAKEAMLEEMSERPVLATRAPALHKYSMMAFYPRLSGSKAMELSPPVTAGLNADFDGDTMNFHLPISDAARDEAIKKMLPSASLRSPADFKVMYAPRQEFLQGLYLASTRKSGKKMLAPFASKKDVVAAFKRGELGIEDIVRVRDEDQTRLKV
jgi:DNA-directed RNA polymerase beta subunit